MSTKRATSRRERSTMPIIVDRGNGWHVERDPLTADYNAYISDQYVGSRALASAARALATSTAARQPGAVVTT